MFVVGFSLSRDSPARSSQVVAGAGVAEHCNPDMLTMDILPPRGNSSESAEAILVTGLRMLRRCAPRPVMRLAWVEASRPVVRLAMLRIAMAPRRAIVKRCPVGWFTPGDSGTHHSQ